MNLRKYSPVLRAVGIIGVVAGLVTAVTFAALQSQATLTSNTIASATAQLAVSSTSGCSAVTGTFGQTETGFAFTGLVPGGTDSGAKTFCLQNTGTDNMSVNVKIPVFPTWTVTPPGTVDNSQVNLAFTCTGAGGTFAVTDNVNDIGLNTANLSGGTLNAGTTDTCTVTASMTSSAFTGESASSTTFDLTFTGTGV